MSARRAIGVSLIFSPAVAVVATGLIFDTRDAAIGFGIVLVFLIIMGLGVWLMERDR